MTKYILLNNLPNLLMAYFGLVDSDYGGADPRKGWIKASCSKTNILIII